MNQTPRTREDLDRLILNEVQESLHLDYKDSRALSKAQAGEIAKDVSAFANSDGGALIYGIAEKGHLPVRIDDGIANGTITREWIEQCIDSNISPKIVGTEVVQITLTEDRSAFVIVVPKSYRGPHQEGRKKRYYKRYNFKSAPMEDYEIADVRARSSVVPPLLNIDAGIRQHTLCNIIIENIGGMVAHDVAFEFPPDLLWGSSMSPPPLIQRGVKYFGPGKLFEIMYNTTHVLLRGDAVEGATFDVGVSYRHPLTGKRKAESFHLSFSDYLDTMQAKSDVQEQGGRIEKALKKLTSEVANLGKSVDSLRRVAGPTGLSLSVSTLRNLRRVIQSEGKLEKLSAQGQDASVFSEVLGIDRDLASRLTQFFWQSSDISNIQDDIEEMDKEAIQLLRECFLVTEAPNEDRP